MYYYPFSKKSLRNNIGDSKYSFLIGESTNINVLECSKHSGISYFSKNTKTVTTYLSLQPLENENADGILHTFQNCLKN